MKKLKSKNCIEQLLHRIWHSGNSALRVQCIWTRWWIYHTSSQACIMDPCVRVWLGGVSWGALCVSWPLWELAGCIRAVCVWLCSCWTPQVHRPSITRCGHYTQAGVEVDNAPTAATAGASTACGSSVWLASSNQADSGLPVCVTDNVTNTHLYTRARKYTRATNPHTHTHNRLLVCFCDAKRSICRGVGLTKTISH